MAYGAETGMERDPEKRREYWAHLYILPKFWNMSLSTSYSNTLHQYMANPNDSIFFLMIHDFIK